MGCVRKSFFLHCIDLIGEIDVYLTGYACCHDKPFRLVNTHTQMFIYGPTSWLIEMETQKNGIKLCKVDYLIPINCTSDLLTTLKLLFYEIRCVLYLPFSVFSLGKPLRKN